MPPLHRAPADPAAGPAGVARR